ncbi:MAG: adenylyltransferase/cytidyltransferase family protein [Candidatus Bilamarchaeaceae archaeon]
MALVDSKQFVSKLYVLQLRHRGIPPEIYETLSLFEKNMLYRDEGKYFLSDDARKSITVVLTGGVFDLIHYGHVLTLSKAREQGDVLVVVVAQDRFIEAKKRAGIHPLEYRVKLVEALKAVDTAVSGYDDPNRVLADVKPDVVVYGYDQKPFMKPAGVKVVQLTDHIEPENFKTSNIIRKYGL